VRSSMIVSKSTGQILVPYDDVRLKEVVPGPIKTIEHENVVYAVLPHTPRTQMLLRAGGVESPSPILFHYDWASSDGATPFQVQKNTASLATGNQRAYILNDMGTGKTKAALWSWRYLFNLGVAKKLLVVAPLSTLKFVWMKELRVTMPEIKVAVLHGTRAQRLKMLSTEADVYIINHDGLKSIALELHNRKDIDAMIIDELAVYRNNSQRSKRMRDFAVRFVWVWGLTGRPMPNAPTDVWNQCKILTPGTIPKFFRHAKSMLMLQVSQFKWVPKSDAIDTALTWMKPSVRYALDDVTELPEAIHRTVDVDMTEEQALTYRKLANEFAAMVQNQTITAANAGVAMGKLLQVGAGYLYSKNPLHVVLDSEPRQQMLLELINEAPHKVIVFAPWRHLIEGLDALLTDEDIDHAVVHGDITKRETIFSAFQNTTQYRVLLAHPQCVHHGLTLTSATTIIWYSPVCSLEIYEQANARIRRVGQKHKQLFLHLQSSQIERKVYEMLRRKQRTQDAFLEMIKTSMTNGEPEYDET
jgi:SNF2 family DNA or RNA helicase